MSQQSLAEALGISFQQIQKYEKGMNRVTAGRIRQICEALQIPFEKLVGAATEESGVASEKLEEIQQFLATKDGYGLMTSFQAIKDSRVRREVTALVRSIAENENRKRRRRRT